jgi:hypothetical protein
VNIFIRENSTLFNTDAWIKILLLNDSNH